jgi:hypothetical protein
VFAAARAGDPRSFVVEQTGRIRPEPGAGHLALAAAGTVGALRGRWPA